MKAFATDKTSTRTRRSMKIESAIEILTELLGSREEVLATLSEMLVADCEFTEKQRREIFEEIKRLHKGKEVKFPTRVRCYDKSILTEKMKGVVSLAQVVLVSFLDRERNL